jgi:tRNA G18 (ribose-2'-O)-methylase SpoU
MANRQPFPSPGFRGHHRPVTLIPIHSADDPRIAAYRDIRERDLVGREGRFIAEGEVVLRVLATASRHDCESVLIDARRLEKLRPILDDLSDDTPVYLADRAVVDAIAGFPLHRGILAIGRRAPATPADRLLSSAPARAAVVALFGISNHDNLGGVFRNAAAFGVHGVLLGPGCCDPLYRKAIRVSVGAALRVPFAYLAEGDDPIATLAAHGFEALALSPAGATTLAALSPSARTAILLGAEGPGLPAALMSRCRTVRIPMAEGWDSLNVATTSGIVLHHLGVR